MPFADNLRAAISAMREDSDPRWHSVADLLSGGPLGYASISDGRPDPAAYAQNYPDLQHALTVAEAYLGVDR